MKSIYVITNTENGKQYVGQTSKSPEERLKKHIESKKYHPDRAMYKDMNDMGTDVFKVELLEQCDDDLGNERETYWIERLEVIEKGYNDQMEGYYMPRLSDEERIKIVNMYKELKSGWKVATETRHSSQTVYKILREFGIEPDGTNERKIQIDQLGMSFNSITECAEWLQTNQDNITARTLGVIQSIYHVINGYKKSYRGYTFSYLD